jgi:hypothetical protein
MKEKQKANYPFNYLEFDDFVKCGYLRELFMS